MYKVKRNKNVRYTFPRVEEDYGMKILFYNKDTGEDFVANRLAALIWYLIESEKSVEEISEAIIDVCGSENKDILEKDINGVLKIMLKAQLIKLVE